MSGRPVHGAAKTSRRPRIDLLMHTQTGREDPLHPLPQARQSMQDAEDRWNLLVRHVTDYAIILLDPRGRVSGWNAGAERLLGYREEEILGQPSSIFFTPE